MHFAPLPYNVAPLPFKTFQSFNRCAPFKPFLGRRDFLPATAGEDEGGGLNDLNGLNQFRVS